MSEALIFASTNPQYDDRLFIELQVQYMKIPSSNLWRTCCVHKLFLTFRTIFVHNMFSPCSAKRRASDKGLPVQKFLSFLFTISSKNLKGNYTWQYCCVEKSAIFFYKLRNKRDFLKIINLYYSTQFISLSQCLDRPGENFRLFWPVHN